MRQNEIITPVSLLDRRGHITEEGWGRHPHWEYRRDDIRASWLRIKEWDYYYVLSDDLKRGITFTISDLGYAALVALCWLDFESGEAFQVDSIAALTRGGLFNGSAEDGLTPDSGTLCFEDSKIFLRFETGNGKRRILFRVPGLEIGSGVGLEGELLLRQPSEAESINIATSWAENRKRFYYNRKINCMPASGTVMAGGQEYQFRPETASGGLDWGRGAWTYVNRWYWSSASGTVDGTSFGFNLGYGFSDRSPATENIIFSDGVGHKLGDVRFEFDSSDYMAPWRFLDDEGRLELDFVPILDRFGAFNLLAIKSVQHQVFGYFSGRAVLDDGKVFQLKDFLGFTEDVYNRW